METTENNTVQASSNEAIVNEGKSIALIAYITLIGLIVAFVLNRDKKNDFAGYHIRQSLGLALTGLALGVIGVIPILGWIIDLVGIFVLFYMWIVGFVNAMKGNEKPVPILGKKFIEWFKSI
jgi:uncharacterized membrane protein